MIICILLKGHISSKGLLHEEKNTYLYLPLSPSSLPFSFLPFSLHSLPRFAACDRASYVCACLPLFPPPPPLLPSLSSVLRTARHGRELKQLPWRCQSLVIIPAATLCPLVSAHDILVSWAQCSVCACVCLCVCAHLCLHVFMCVFVCVQRS